MHMINRIKNNFKQCQRRLKEGWFFRGYNYSVSERERFYRRPSDWVIHLFVNGELSTNQRMAARCLAAERSGGKREWAEFMVACLSAIAEGDMDIDEGTRQITEKAAKEDGSVCHHGFWLELRRTLIALGFLRAGGIMRDRALNTLFAQLELSGRKYAPQPLAIFQAALECGDFDTAGSYVKDAGDSPGEKKGSLLSPLPTLFGQFKNRPDREIRQALRLWDRPFQRLRQLVQDKSVAIVGPSVTESELSSEIDSHEVVVRCGFMGPSSLPPGAGEKTSVSFYAGHKVRELVSRGQSKALNALELVLLKHSSDRERLREIGVDDKFIGVSLPARQAFFDTHPMAIPQVVHNLVFARPRGVKVFKVNFFLEPGYPAGYEIGREIRKDQGWKNNNYKVQDPAAKCESFANVHDPLAQFRFMKHAWRCGLIKGDKEFTDIINLSGEEYLRRLENIYGYNGTLRLSL